MSFPAALGGQAHERDAVAKPLSLLDLEVDEDAEEQLVDDPPAADGERSEPSPFGHCRAVHARRGTIN
jgi:hypothetical protein